MMRVIISSLVFGAFAAHAGVIDAFVSGDFEDSAFHGRLDKYTESGRGFGYNGNGGAHVSGFMRHCFAVPVKPSLRLVGRFAVNGEGEVRMSVEPGGTIMVVR